jgi:predicted MPP superfamily phosphohydrolase
MTQQKTASRSSNTTNRVAMTLWFLIVLGVLSAGLAYIGWRLITPFALTRFGKIASWGALTMGILLPLIAMMIGRRFPVWQGPLAWVAYVGLGFISFVFTLLVIRDVLFLGGVGIYKLLAFFRSPDGIPLDTARRTFLAQATGLGVIGAAGLLTSYGIYEARKRPGIANVTVPLKNLPPAFDGFRIVQITDIHAGLTIGREWIAAVTEEVAALSPDLIVLTGDLVDGSVPNLREDVEPLAGLQAPNGKFFVTGNHEYYSGAEPWVEEVRRLGFVPLMNEHVLIEKNGDRIVLAGVTDVSAGGMVPQHRSDPERAFAGAPNDTTRILLAHQPRSITAAAPFGVDLQISGHTHGGQFIPWNLLASIGQPYLKGLHDHNGTWVYVSKGTGYWGPPVRLGVRSEITVLTLTQKNGLVD